jgi:hypothetical protein
MSDHTMPSSETRAAEQQAAGKAHEAGPGPTDEEAAAADSQTVEPGVAEHEKEMLEKGAHQQGEGRV